MRILPPPTVSATKRDTYIMRRVSVLTRLRALIPRPSRHRTPLIMDIPMINPSENTQRYRQGRNNDKRIQQPYPSAFAIPRHRRHGAGIYSWRALAGEHLGLGISRWKIFGARKLDVYEIGLVGDVVGPRGMVRFPGMLLVGEVGAEVFGAVRGVVG